MTWNRIFAWSYDDGQTSPGGRCGRGARRARNGFTLIELILVMTILTIAVSITAPALANFFRGRTLDSEARRLLALTRQGQSRAVSEGVPMELWIDTQNARFGLEAEPSYETTDPKAVDFPVDSDIKLEAINDGNANNSGMNRPRLGMAMNSSTGQILSRHPELPKIRFLPDGSISETSTPKLCLTGRDGGTLWLVQSKNGFGYEISSRGN